MQAMKMFQGGGGSASSGGGGQSQMISMAMQEASKLFDSQASQGNVAGKSRESSFSFANTNKNQGVPTSSLLLRQLANSLCRCT